MNAPDPPDRCEQCGYRGTLFRLKLTLDGRWLCGRCMFGTDRRDPAA